MSHGYCQSIGRENCTFDELVFSAVSLSFNWHFVYVHLSLLLYIATLATGRGSLEVDLFEAFLRRSLLLQLHFAYVHVGLLVTAQFSLSYL